MARSTNGLDNSPKNASVSSQERKETEEPLLEGPSKARKEQLEHFVELSVRFRKIFGEENTLKIACLFNMESFFDDEKFKSGQIDNEWLSSQRGMDIQSLITCLEYFLKLDHNQTESLLYKLSLPVKWPTAVLADDIRERKKMLAIIIRNDIVSEFIEQIEQRFLEPKLVAVEKREKERASLEMEEERRRQDEENKAAVSEKIRANSTLRNFLLMLPNINAGKVDKICSSWIPKEIPKEAVHLAWSAELGAELIELCNMSKKLEAIRNMNPRYMIPRALSFLPGKYWHTNNACSYHKVVRDYYMGKLTKDECLDMLGFFDVSVIDLSDDKTCLKHKHTGTTMTIFRDGIQRIVDTLENQKMLLRLKMGLNIKNVIQSVELQIADSDNG